MIDKKTLAHISRGIRAAGRVRNTYDMNVANRVGFSEASNDRTALLNELLSAIVEFYPGNARRHFAESLELSSKYFRNYRNIKNYIFTILKQLD